MVRLVPAALVLLLAPPAPARAGEPSRDDRPAGAPIVNGAEEDGFPGVAALGADFGNPFSACSGALITPRVALTAAHCGADLPTELIVAVGQAFFGPDVDAAVEQFGFEDYIGHEDYEPLTNQPGSRPANDVGVGILDGEASAPPYLINTRTITRDDEGTTLYSVGFGVTGPGRDDGGVKRGAAVDLTGIDDDFILSANSASPNEANICSGDSGGPMFFVDDAGRAVIWAVHSWGDQDCAQVSGSTRTDLMADWILDRVEEVHDSRDLCAINGRYGDGVCEDDLCPDDAEDCAPPDDEGDDDDDGAGGAACSGCAASTGGGVAPPAWLLLTLLALPLRARRHRDRSVVRASRAAVVAAVLAVAVVAPAVALAAKPTLPALSAEDMAKARAGTIVLTKTTNAAGESVVNALVELAATADKLWPIVFSPEHVKASSSSVKVCSPTRDVTQPDGQRSMDLDYVLKVGFSEIKYSVNRHYVPAEETMRWTLDRSRPADIEWTEGSYSTYPGSAPGRTLFLYRARIVTGKAIPGWLEEDLTESSLKRYLKYLQATAEGT